MPRPNKQDTRTRFITRMHDPLWRVWVQFGEMDFGVTYFSDRGYGSKLLSLKAAMRHRDSLVAQHNIPLRVYAGNGFCVRNKNSTSGVVGITLTVDDRDNPTKVNWSVRSMRNGKQRHVARSILKYGYEEAWRLVAEIRREHTQQPVPIDPPRRPKWLVEWMKLRGCRCA